MPVSSPVVLLPDAGPLITLAYADELDLFLKPGWGIGIVDMVLHEVTRSQTPTSHKIEEWVKTNTGMPVSTKVYQQHMQDIASNVTPVRKSHLGEMAAQEAMITASLMRPPPQCVFVFEEYRIASTKFVIPGNSRKVSTKAFLIFLEQQGWISSAADIEQKAIKNGRNFSQVRFPP
jgi:hypothetical protein